jgi:RHH-type proline utilization regulon transcriptional repressor/proline dehydrogenase/delta 1-pyrroline-5-carboxylate dehydrogenase
MHLFTRPESPDTRFHMQPPMQTNMQTPRPLFNESVLEEAEHCADLYAACTAALTWPLITETARPWVEAVRSKPAPFWALESLLQEYPISTAEGLALMRLAEALLRVPDAQTAVALTADQLGRAAFEPEPASGQAHSTHPWLAGLSAGAIGLSKRFLPTDTEGDVPLLKRLGAQTVVAATVRAIRLLGRQFVLGQTIAAARAEAQSVRREAGAQHAHQWRYSYDMLGEGARTEADALRYLAAYQHAIAELARAPQAGLAHPETADGISIKLSALFPRFEELQRMRVLSELVPRVAALLEQAAAANINLTIDAEETERLELSLEVFEALLEIVAARHPQWRGFGLAIQAYQVRALPVVQHVATLARRTGVRLMVRLVKGAYWDAEIKRAQELGLAHYPVFTHKHHTDLAYLACARALLEAAPAIYPQFATHNAGTIAAVLHMARATGAAFELQRLHGMGEAVMREVLAQAGDAGTSLSGLEVACRVYAPVGEHRDLLAYLVRRLLENGANSSFVHQLTDPAVPVEALLASPMHVACESALALPPDLFSTGKVPGRRNAQGHDLLERATRSGIECAMARTQVPAVPLAARTLLQAETVVAAAFSRALQVQPAWSTLSVDARASMLERAALALEGRYASLVAVLAHEAHKTPGDAISEVREAVDFCRYYAQQARLSLEDVSLPGPTGESNILRMHGRGVFVCISPWNFPLAIFVGQVAAALVAGNAVLAKPAEQTPGIAAMAVEILHEVGVPRDALQLLHGDGETVGAALVRHAACGGVAFTGSTTVARHIARSLVDKPGALVPLIAETGGINAMIVDSTALPEQVVDAVVTSAFRSAGQRCSALRVLCVQDDIADDVLAMLAGAMAELRLGRADDFSTDVGPVIDAAAHDNLNAHIKRLETLAAQGKARRIARTPVPEGDVPPHLIAPVAYELGSLADLSEEVFGPVLHVLRWKANELDALVDDINALGYGLTLGVQTRIDSRAQRIAARARVGNIYVNRNMIGAVVGVQPFGGEGMSGTGPKAGGPHYLLRFSVERTVTVNTAAAGGNAALLAGTL